MKKKRVYLILFSVLILAFFSFNLSYPNYFNGTVDFLNSKLGFQFPHFWNPPFRLGLDLQGGTHLIYEADLSGVEEGDRTSAMQGLRDIIERRVNLFGVQEPVVQTQETSGHNRLVVELAGVKDPAEAIKMIGQTPFLEFRKQRPQEDSERIIEKLEEIQGKSLEEIQNIENWQLSLEDPYFESTELTGKYLKKSELSFDQNTQKPLILLQFNDDGAKVFEALTEESIGKQLAIYIDGVLLSAPTVQEKISGGKAQITGSFTVKEAQDLVKNLNAGALPVPIQLISQQSVGPTLGMVSLQRSLTAAVYGLLAVVIFMVLFYRLPGLLASISLGVYIALILALFKLIPVTLTLAGIGGFILSIGMAVDANVLIFSRIREELKEGKSFGVALEEGFRRSWPSIRDGNFTTILVALILFSFGTSFIKGFALTLIVGILVSIFSAIVVTRALMRIFAGTVFEKWRWIW